MSSPPIPTKPPRGVKQGKETSGLLMSVIRTLSASETNEQREKERAKLEKEYKKSDARLDELVAEHAQEIMDVMQKFTLVNEALQSWGAHGEAAVARLTACRGLLRLRRADLRRLWADARTHHHALSMLTDIERVVVSEREAVDALSARRVLSAALTLRSALALADTTLAHVTALHSTRQNLQAKKREVVDTVVRRLFDCVLRNEERTPLARRHSERRRTALLLAELTKPSEVSESYLTEVTVEWEAALTQEQCSLESAGAVALEALAVLGQLREAAEKFKVQIQNELMEIIDQVSQRIIEEGDVELEAEEEDGAIPEDEGVTEAARPLTRLVACLTEEFEACGANNKRLIQLWRAALQKHGLPESCVHTEQNYWSAVQQVMQLLLTEYLEIESVTLAAARGGRAVESTHETKISDYFGKKRPQRRREKLFRLAESSASVVPRAPRSRLVTAPHPAHLSALLPRLHRLCAHIETIQGGECSLRAFITDYVKSGESERLASEARASIEAAARAGGAWTERTPPPANAALPPSDRPSLVFLCCAAAWQALERAAGAARRCGASGGQHAARAATQAIGALATQCLSAYSRLCPLWSRAARWLADDDIVRFLQSLPNWKAMLQPNDKPSQQELTQAYEREAEILGSSLGDGAVARREIIADVSALVDLATLAESMAWLSASIRTLPAIITAPSAGGAVRLPEKFAADVAAAAAIFDDIAHKCLLLLHLEVRIECFHYLGEEDRGEDEAGGGGGGAAQLSARLLQLHEGAAMALAPQRLGYVLNGVGEMMSAGVVWRWQESSGSGASVGAGAAGRLACLRHCLAALQLPHSGLQRATDYLHLLNCEPEEIIASVKEKGAQFTELEYLNAFKLIGARRGLQPAEMRAHLKQLSSALGHVGVTV